MKFKKINTEGFTYQGYHNFYCPECDFNFHHGMGSHIDYLIGYSSNPNISFGYKLAFECPKCFTKSWCHCDKNHIESIKLNLSIRDIK
jgi:hypothetical protein